MPYDEIRYQSQGDVAFLTFGLINKIVAIEDLDKETLALAEKINEASGFVLAIGKQGFYAQVDQPDNHAFHYAKYTITMNLTAEDAQAGIQAFLDKEKPEWKNR